MRYIDGDMDRIKSRNQHPYVREAHRQQPLELRTRETAELRDNHSYQSSSPCEVSSLPRHSSSPCVSARPAVYILHRPFEDAPAPRQLNDAEHVADVETGARDYRFI